MVFVWKSRNGRRYTVSEMSDTHVQNTLRKIEEMYIQRTYLFTTINLVDADKAKQKINNKTLLEWTLIFENELRHCNLKKLPLRT